MAEWHTPESIREEWPDAQQIPDPVLDQLLIVAKAAVLAYAPALPEQPEDGTQEIDGGTP